jgi:hypothetical protein
MLIPDLWTTPQLLAVGLMGYMLGHIHAMVVEWWEKRKQ